MPFSIPTFLALKFVSNNNLRNRVNLLQKSYKAQVAGLTIFTVANFDKTVVSKPLLSLALL